MKYYLAIILLSLISSGTFAQSSSPGYKAQSIKLNNLLDERNVKFEQYQNSLEKRSGIFGGKTKKDINQSIEILSEIIETDNNILRETRVLLDYKEVEKAKVEDKVSNVEGRVKGYMSSIAKLRNQNGLLVQEIASLQKQNDNYILAMFFLGLSGLALLLLGLRRKR